MGRGRPPGQSPQPGQAIWPPGRRDGRPGRSPRRRGCDHGRRPPGSARSHPRDARLVLQRLRRRLWPASLARWRVMAQTRHGLGLLSLHANVRTSGSAAGCRRLPAGVAPLPRCFERDARDAPLSARHDRLGRLSADGRAIRSPGSRGRQDEIPPAEDAPVRVDGSHFLLASPPPHQPHRGNAAGSPRAGQRRLCRHSEPARAVQRPRLDLHHGGPVPHRRRHPPGHRHSRRVRRSDLRRGQGPAPLHRQSAAGAEPASSDLASQTVYGVVRTPPLMSAPLASFDPVMRDITNGPAAGAGERGETAHPPAQGENEVVHIP